MTRAYTLPEPDFLPYPRQYVYEPSYSAEQMRAAYAAGVETGIKACTAKMRMMNEPSKIRLAIGEMSAQEMRTAKAVCHWFIANCQMLLDDCDQLTVDAIKASPLLPKSGPPT